MSRPYSHSKTDDPIVFPGQPGASHLHDFFGNNSVDAFSDESSLRAANTTCSTSDNLSGYWEPEMYLNGKPHPAEDDDLLRALREHRADALGPADGRRRLARHGSSVDGDPPGELR